MNLENSTPGERSHTHKAILFLNFIYMKCSRTGKSIDSVVSGHPGLGEPREQGMAKGEECVLKSVLVTGAPIWH